MKFLFSVLISLFFVTSSYAATGLETGKGDPGSYLYNPFGESELTAVLSITNMKLENNGVSVGAETSFGLGMDVAMGSGKFKFMTGLHYVKFKSESTTADIENSYLMIPVGVKLYPMVADSALYLKGGINPMILVDGEDNSESLGFLANVGLGYKFTGSHDISLEVTYNLALTEVDETSQLDYSGVIFGLGIGF